MLFCFLLKRPQKHKKAPPLRRRGPRSGEISRRCDATRSGEAFVVFDLHRRGVDRGREARIVELDRGVFAIAVAGGLPPGSDVQQITGQGCSVLRPGDHQGHAGSAACRSTNTSSSRVSAIRRGAAKIGKPLFYEPARARGGKGANRNDKRSPSTWLIG